ncbi:MAG: Gfo/Idh/MocA family oxidoreductase [Eubacteriales bacterium]|nr:Gfo/Idh/MocA family oxidoreductase [Eubacteriales bacterium]
MKEIRIGLIGGGWMGKAHTTAFHNAKMIFGDDIPVFEVVSDIKEQEVATFAKQMGYRRYTTDWREVVADPDVDLVDVATPNCMHFAMAKAALEHGKHVFCEKPLSLSAEESRILADLAKQKGVVNYCGFSNVMNPANQYVAELVKSGKLGKIMRVHATYDQDMLLDPAIPLAWRHINQLAGSGALGDLCSHLLSVSQMIVGDIEAVSAVQSIVIPERPIKAGASEMGKVENDDLITFLVKYQNGAIGDFSSSRVATGRKNYFYYEIQGTEGTVVYNLERMCEVQVYFKSDADVDNGRDCGFRTVLLNPQHEGFQWFQPAGGIAIAFDDMKTLQAHTLMQALHGGAYSCDFEMGAKVDGVIDAVLRSVRSGQWETC